MNISPVASGSASPKLLGAALAGLLCLAACSKDDAPTASGSAGAAGESTQPVAGNASAGTGADARAAGAAGVGGVAAGGAAGDGGNGAELGGAGAGAGGSAVVVGGGGNEGGAAGSSSSAGAGGSAEESPHVTSSKDAGVLTEEQFKALCDERGGTVEVMPHCGGFATAKGFSYDNVTMLLSEHTCHGANTCGGWNCVIAD